MDKATFIGLIGALGLTYYCTISTELTATGGNEFLNPQALVLVFFGSICCTLMSVPWPTFLDGVRVARKVLFHPEVNLVSITEKLVDCSQTARREGPLSLEKRLASADEDPFLVKGLQMVIDGNSAEEVEGVLRVEMIGLRARHKRGQQLFVLLGKYAPAFGLLTTLIGEVMMFKGISSGSVLNVGTIGQGMAVALLGTLYGVILSNLVYLPFADKLDSRSAQEMLVKELYIQTAQSIANEESPTLLRQKLLGFMDNRVRSALEQTAA